MKNILIPILAILVFSCSDSSSKSGSDNRSKDNFNREALLKNWVNNLIVPHINEFDQATINLITIHNLFANYPTLGSLEAFQTQLFIVQKKWQHIAMFEMGKAEELNYRKFIYTYPVDFDNSPAAGNSSKDVSTVTDNLQAKLGDKTLAIDKINLGITSRADEQGLPTLDYLLNGVAQTPQGILNFYTTHSNATNHKLYLKTLVYRISTLTRQVGEYWRANASQVIRNAGSSATASVDILVNRFIFYTEQGFREAKIATPSGKRNGTPNVKAVESYYSSKRSKELLLESFAAIQAFYKGIHYKTGKNGIGLDDYLNFLNATEFDSTQAKEVNLAKRIDELLKAIDEQLAKLNQDLTLDVQNDNTKLLSTFNTIQQLVVVLKTNVTSSINVKIDFVDGDGD